MDAQHSPPPPDAEGPPPPPPSEAPPGGGGDVLPAILDAAPVGLQLLDAAGNVRYWNRASEQLYGWAAAEVVGAPPPHVPPDRRGELDDLVRRAFAGERCGERETR